LSAGLSAAIPLPRAAIPIRRDSGIFAAKVAQGELVSPSSDTFKRKMFQRPGYFPENFPVIFAIGPRAKWLSGAKELCEHDTR
jgi:hypothetical protein